MTSQQQFTIALLTFLFTVALPYAFSMILKMKGLHLDNLKKIEEANKEVIKQLIITAETIYTAGNGVAKYKWVVNKAAEILNIPSADLEKIIETCLLELKLEFGAAWDAIEAPVPSQTTANEPTISAVGVNNSGNITTP